MYVLGEPRSQITGLPKTFNFLAIFFVILDSYVHLLSKYCLDNTIPSLQLKYTRHLLVEQCDRCMGRDRESRDVSSPDPTPVSNVCTQ